MQKIFLLILFTIGFLQLDAQNVRFEIESPKVVVTDTEFHIKYILTSPERGQKQILNFKRLGMEVVKEPVITYKTIKTNRVSQPELIVTTFDYTMIASKTGVFSLPEAKLRINNITYRTGTPVLRVSNSSVEEFSKANSKELFIRVIPTKMKINNKEEVLAYVRLYSLAFATQSGKVEFAKSKAFKVKEDTQPLDQQVKEETYKGETYKTIDLMRIWLTPKQKGMLATPDGVCKVKYDTSAGAREEVINLQSVLINVQ